MTGPVIYILFAIRNLIILEDQCSKEEHFEQFVICYFWYSFIPSLQLIHRHLEITVTKD